MQYTCPSTTYYWIYRVWASPNQNAYAAWISQSLIRTFIFRLWNHWVKQNIMIYNSISEETVQICRLVCAFALWNLIFDTMCSTKYWPRYAKTCLQVYADTEGLDKPAHLHSLIRAFTVRNNIIGYYRMYEKSKGPDDTLCMRRMIWIWACSKAFFGLAWPIS